MYMPSFWREYTYWYLISLALRKKWPTFHSRRHFRVYFPQWKRKYLDKWSKFRHGIRYWLGAFQATSHCLNQCWHSSSMHIYFSRRDWVYDRTITKTEMLSGWLPWLSLGALRPAFSVGFSASGDGWGVHPGDISVPLIKPLCIHIYLYTVSYCGFMCLFILIIVLINMIFYLCVLNAFISYHRIFCVFIHLCIESRGLVTFWC